MARHDFQTPTRIFLNVTTGQLQLTNESPTGDPIQVAYSANKLVTDKDHLVQLAELGVKDAGASPANKDASGTGENKAPKAPAKPKAAKKPGKTAKKRTTAKAKKKSA